MKKAADEGHVHSMNELGITYREAKRLPEAIEVLKKAADEGNIQSFNELGITYREAKRLPEAIEVLKKGLDKRPKNSFLKYTLFQIHCLFEPNIEVAKHFFSEMPDKFPTGQLRVSYQQVLDNFESILAFETNDNKLFRTYIWLLFRYQSWEWAVVFLEKLTQIHPSVEFKANFGKALLMVGRAKEAKPLLKVGMKATDRPGMEKYFRQNAADYLDALKLSGSNKEVRKTFERLRERLSHLPDFELRKVYWLGE